MCYDLSFYVFCIDYDTINTVKHIQLFQNSYDIMLLTVITVKPNGRPFNTCSKRMELHTRENEAGLLVVASESTPVALQRINHRTPAGASRDKQAVCPSRSASQRENGPCRRLARCVGDAAQRVTGHVLVQCHARALCRRCSTPEGGLEAASR